MKLSDFLKSGPPHYIGENATENIIPAVEKLEQTNAELLKACKDALSYLNSFKTEWQDGELHLAYLLQSSIAKAEQK